MTDATHIHRAMLVQRHTDVSWHHWVRLTSRADDGRDPTRADGETINNRLEQAVDD